MILKTSKPNPWHRLYVTDSENVKNHNEHIENIDENDDNNDNEDNREEATTT